MSELLEQRIEAAEENITKTSPEHHRESAAFCSERLRARMKGAR